MPLTIVKLLLLGFGLIRFGFWFEKELPCCPGWSQRLGSSDPLTSTSKVAGTAGMQHCPEFEILFKRKKLPGLTGRKKRGEKLP